MCENGVNIDQMQLMITQVNDSLAMSQQWLERIHHLAGHADISDVSTTVAQATVLLGETRAKLDDAASAIESEAEAGFSVERV